MTAAEMLELADNRHRQGDLPRAIEAYRRVVAADSALSRAWWGLGCAQTTLGQYAGAVASFARLVEIVPDYGEAWHNLGKALFELGQIGPALDAFQKALALLGPHEMILGMMAIVIPGSPRADSQAVLDVRRRWAEQCLPASISTGRMAPSRSTARPIRLGYVSSFFQSRNWMKPVWGVINNHDRSRFEIHLFSDAPESSIRHGYVRHESDRFWDTTGKPNEEVARLIAEREIDILVDLNGYSKLPRLPLMAMRPAPQIVSWFNCYATSGMSCFDYVVGDENVIPIGEERFCSEPIVRVPGSYLPFEVNYPVPEVASAPCLTRGYLTFGCLAPQYKITTEAMEAWSKVLRGSPTSRLILKNTILAAPEARDFVTGIFARFGIPAERLELEGPAEHYAFLEKYAAIDIALDSFPYNGGTTTAEALWQGVPVLTFYGNRWTSRISASMLRAGGLPELVAMDLDGYVEHAIALANSPDTPALLDDLRRNLRHRLSRTPLCDMPAFTRSLERIYLERWNRHADDSFPAQDFDQ